MATASLEERVKTLEAEVERIKTRFPEPNGVTPAPWWEQRFGAFANSKEYEEATSLGREYRESLRPTNEEGAAA